MKGVVPSLNVTVSLSNLIDTLESASTAVAPITFNETINVVVPSISLSVTGASNAPSLPVNTFHAVEESSSLNLSS